MHCMTKKKSFKKIETGDVFAIYYKCTFFNLTYLKLTDRTSHWLSSILIFPEKCYYF